MTSNLEETMVFAELLFALAKELADGTICQKMEKKKIFKCSRIRSLSGIVTFKFQSKSPTNNDLNQVSSISLLITSSKAHVSERLFELTQHPMLTLAVLLSFTETTEEPGCSQVNFA